MNPPAMIEALIPILATLIVFGMPVAIVFITKYFKLKNRELELDSDLQKKWTEDQRRQLEARVASMENAMQAMLQIIAPRVPAAQQQSPLGTPVSARQLAPVAEPPPDGTAPRAPSTSGQRERS